MSRSCSHQGSNEEPNLDPELGLEVASIQCIPSGGRNCLQDALYHSLLRGVDRTRPRFGDFVDFLSVTLDELPPSSSYFPGYRVRLRFDCELQQIITREALAACNLDLFAEIGAVMAERLVRTIRKVVLKGNAGAPGPSFGPVETRLDSSVPQGVVLMHPQTFYELMSAQHDPETGTTTTHTITSDSSH